MTDRSFEPSVTFALDILLDQLDPRREQLDAAARAARQLCGQWIVFRRIQRRLNNEMIVSRTALEPYQITALEAGQGEPGLFAEQKLHCLSLILEDEQHDFAWVKQVISGAAGAAPVPEALLNDIRAEVHAPAQDATLASPTEAASAVSATLEMHLRPEVYDVMVALERGATTGLTIKKAIAARSEGRSPIGLTTIHAILSYLLKNDLALAPALAPAPAAAQQQIYHLTPEGHILAQQAMRIQETRQRASEKTERAQQELQEADKQLEELSQRMPWSRYNPAPV